MLSKAVARLAPSATLAITAKAKQMAAAGEKVIKFAAGEPDFDTPKLAKEAAKKAIDEGFTKYTASSGIPELKQAIVDKFWRDNGLKYSLNQVLASNGAKQVLFEIIFSLCEDGDEVLIPAPFWVSFTEMVKAARAKPVVVKTGKDLKLTPALLAKAINRKTKLLILNAPSNPAGVMYSKAELVELAKVILKHKKMWVISDECYDHFYYLNKPQVSFAALSKKAYQRTITVNACSKSFSMTGWRLGYCAGPEKIIEAMARLQDHLSSNPCSITQKAAIAALNNCRDFPGKMRKEFAKRRKAMVEGLNEIKGIKAVLPDGAFYVFADISQLEKDSFKFALKLLDEAKVAVIPGKPFGAEGYIRASFACSTEDIKEGVKRIKEHVEKAYAGH